MRDFQSKLQIIVYQIEVKPTLKLVLNCSFESLISCSNLLLSVDCFMIVAIHLKLFLVVLHLLHFFAEQLLQLNIWSLSYFLWQPRYVWIPRLCQDLVLFIRLSLFISERLKQLPKCWLELWIKLYIILSLLSLSLEIKLLQSLSRLGSLFLHFLFPKQLLKQLIFKHLIVVY